jgi:RNA polymerase sigma-70 factor (ECF subfamily)
MSEHEAGDILPIMTEAHQRFLALVAEVRPELHRYCARMTGSVIDGEDVVQDTLAKALFALGQMSEPPNLRPWLFRIAHNTAIDFTRRYERRHVELVEEPVEELDEQEMEVDGALIEAALSVFVSLPPLQRSTLALKDVLGHSLEQIAQTVGTTVPSVKAALVRAPPGRASSLAALCRALQRPGLGSAAHHAARGGAA